MNNKYHKDTNGLFYAPLGGIISYLLYMFLFEIIGGRDIEGAVMTGTVTLSIVICFCTGKLLDKLNR
jgi:hypothetical protein